MLAQITRAFFWRADAIAFGPFILLLCGAGLLAISALNSWFGFRTDSLGPSDILPFVALSLALRALRITRDWHRSIMCCDALAVAGVIFHISLTLPWQVQAFSLPLWDIEMRRFDMAIGFDYVAYVNWLNDHPWMVDFLRIPYRSFVVQIFLLVPFLIACGKILELERYMAAYLVCLAMACSVSVLMPTAGAITLLDLHLANTPAWPRAATDLAAYFGLRDGTLRQLAGVPQLGIISFPSFHVASGVLVTFSLRTFRYLFWLTAVLNALMAFAAINWGGHYVADVVGGIACAVIALPISAYGCRAGRWLVGRIWEGSKRIDFRSLRFARGQRQKIGTFGIQRATLIASEKAVIARHFWITFGFIAIITAAKAAYAFLEPSPLWSREDLLLYCVASIALGLMFLHLLSWRRPATLFFGLGLLVIAAWRGQHTACLAMFTGRSIPFADELLSRWDKWLGFDWVGMLGFFNTYPTVNAVFRVAYTSIELQALAIVCFLAVTQQHERMFRLLVVSTFAFTVTILIGMLAPALGPYEFYRLSPIDHANIRLITEARMTVPLLWLRTSGMALPVPEISIGLISFPSFHATSAALYAWALWRTPLVKWIGLGLNILMILATPLHGSHYLVDLFAGLAVAALALKATDAIFSIGLRGVCAFRPQVEFAKSSTSSSASALSPTKGCS